MIQSKYETNASDKELTVLLLLKDRSLFTWRWMSYANKYYYPFKVFIADGGRDKTVQEILSDKSNFPNVNYEYMRYPYDKDYSTYYAKVIDALSLIDTPFVVQVPNDDFYFVDGLRRAMDFLKVYPDYVASGGDMHDFIVESCPRYGMSPFYGSITFTDKIYPAHDLIDDTAIGRLSTYFYGLVNTFLWPAVYRTNNLRSIYQSVVDMDSGDFRFAEHLIYSLTIVAGKTHREDSLYLLHQSNTQEGIGAKVAQEIPTWLHWIRRKGWFEDFSNFVGIVGKAIADYDGVSVEDARKDFKNLYLSLLGKSIVRTFYPKAESSRPKGENNIKLLAEQSCEFKMVEDFLTNGPSDIEIAMCRRTQSPFSPFIRVLKRVKRKFMHCYDVNI